MTRNPPSPTTLPLSLSRAHPTVQAMSDVQTPSNPERLPKNAPPNDTTATRPLRRHHPPGPGWPPSLVLCPIVARPRICSTLPDDSPSRRLLLAFEHPTTTI